MFSDPQWGHVFIEHFLSTSKLALSITKVRAISRPGTNVFSR